MQFQLSNNGWQGLCNPCIIGSNDFSDANSGSGYTLDQLKLTFQAGQDFSLCEILAYSYKNYVPSSTFSFHFISSLLDSNSMRNSGNPAGSITYLNTGKMIGTSQDATIFGSNSHTCNFVNNNNNGGGGQSQNENSYIVMTLPYYLEIKEIYNMGNQRIDFYLGDPFDPFITTLTAISVNFYINQQKSRQIGTWTSVKRVASISDVTSIQCTDLSCTDWATKTIIISNQQYFEDFFTCGFAIMGNLVNCPPSLPQCSHSILPGISAQPTPQIVMVGLTVSTSFHFADPLSKQCQTLSSASGCQQYQTITLQCSTTGNPTYTTPTFGHTFTTAGITNTLTFQPISESDVGQYQCRIDCFMPPSQTQSSSPFSLTINSGLNNCMPTPQCQNTVVAASVSTQNDMTCLVDGIQVRQNFMPFRDSVSVLCTVGAGSTYSALCFGMTYQLMYSNNNTVVASDLAYIEQSNPNNPVVVLVTQKFNYAGSTSVYIKASFNTANYQKPGTTTKNGNQFNLIVDACNSCKFTTLMAYDSSSTSPTSYSIGVENTPGQTLFSKFTDQATQKCGIPNKCGSATYSLVCVAGCPAGTTPPFFWTISVDASGKMKQVSQTTDASLVGVYTVQIQASLDLSSFGQINSPVKKQTPNFTITIDGCNPLPCLYNQINLPVTTGALATTNFLPGTQMVFCNGTVANSNFSEYTDTVSTRCSGSTYQNLCGVKQYAIEYSTFQLLQLATPLSITINFDSINKLWLLGQSTASCANVGDYNVQIHSSFVTPTTTTSDNTHHQFIISVVYPDLCNPLICTSNIIYQLDTAKGDVLPTDFSISTDNKLGQTNFTSFRDYKSENCVGKSGGFINGTTVASFTYPVCTLPTFNVLLASNNQPLSSIFGASNIQFVQLGGSSMALKVRTTSTALDGIHLIYIQGVMGTQYVNTVNFTLTVHDPCNPYNCSLTHFYPDPLGSQPQDVVVAVGQGFQTSIQAVWVDSVSIKCGKIIYTPLCGSPSFSLIQSDDSAVPFEFKVQSSNINTKVQIQVSDPTLSGNNYTVILLGYLLDANGTKYATGNSSEFTVNVIQSNATTNYSTSNAQSTTQNPKFISFPSDYTFYTNTAYEVFTDTASVTENDGNITQIKVSVGSALNFVTFTVKESTVIFKIQPQQNLTVGSYPIQVTAMDANGVQISKNFTITIDAPQITTDFSIPTLRQHKNQTQTFLTSNITQAKNESIPQVSAIIDHISSLGLMQIKFQPPVIPIVDVTQLSSDQYFMTLEQNSIEPDQTKKFSWEIIQSTPFELIVQLKFDAPMSISQGRKPDKIRIWMLRSVLMIYDAQGLYKNWQNSQLNTQDATNNTRRELRQEFVSKFYNNVDNYQFLIADLPKQLSGLPADIQLRENIGKALTAVQVVFWLPFVMQVALPQAMEKTWLIFGSLQSINLMAQLELQTPLNVQSLAQSIQLTANSQFIKNEQVYSWLRTIASDSKKNNSTQKLTNSTANHRNLQFDTNLTEFQQSAFYGFGSSDKVIEAGSQFFVGLFLITMLGLVVWFFQITFLPFLPQKAYETFHKLKDRIFWSLPLRVLSQQYLQLTLAVFINLKFQTTTNFQEQKTNLGLSIILLLFYSIGYPVWMILFLRRYRLMVTDQIFDRKWNSLYQKVEIKKFLALFLLSGVIIRRFLFAFAAVAVSWNIIQLTMIIYLQQMFTIFILAINPMDNLYGNQILFFNEIFISMLCIILYLFTDYIPNPIVRYEVAGWGFCYGVYILVIVTMIVWALDVYEIFRWQVRLRFFYYKLKQRKKQINNHNRFVDKIGKQNQSNQNEVFKKKLEPAFNLDSIESLESLEKSEIKIEGKPSGNIYIDQPLEIRKKEFKTQMEEMKTQYESVGQTVGIQQVLNTSFGQPDLKDQQNVRQFEEQKLDQIFKDLMPVNDLKQNVWKQVQQHSDWPIDPTHPKIVETINKNSNLAEKKEQLWNWENEIASDVSQWNALPSDYSRDKAFEFSADNDRNLNHLGKIPNCNNNAKLQKDNFWISNERQEHDSDSGGAMQAEISNDVDLIFKSVAKRKRKPIVRDEEQPDDDFF